MRQSRFPGRLNITKEDQGPSGGEREISGQHFQNRSGIRGLGAGAAGMPGLRRNRRRGAGQHQVRDSIFPGCARRAEFGPGIPLCRSRLTRFRGRTGDNIRNASPHFFGLRASTACLISGWLGFNSPVPESPRLPENPPVPQFDGAVGDAGQVRVVGDKEDGQTVPPVQAS